MSNAYLCDIFEKLCRRRRKDKSQVGVGPPLPSPAAKQEQQRAFFKAARNRHVTAAEVRVAMCIFVLRAGGETKSRSDLWNNTPQVMIRVVCQPPASKIRLLQCNSPRCALCVFFRADGLLRDAEGVEMRSPEAGKRQ